MRTAPGDHVDVLVVGGGLSGIGTACHLQRECPDRTYAVLEARAATGGTWDLFRYPGVRSDSDMHTLGYSFAPWEDPRAIADGPSILRYVRRTAERFGVVDRIRTGHRVTRADWDGSTARWTVTARVGDDDNENEQEERALTCGFLVMCTGYYRYDRGYTPPLSGVERFGGTLIHPQRWPEDLDYAGKRVIVVGSGATAVTLVPAMAPTAGHVTMLQRSPSYVVTVPSRDGLAIRLRRALPARAAYGIVRWRNVGLMTLSYQLSRRRPRLMKALIRRDAVRRLPAGYAVDTLGGVQLAVDGATVRLSDTLAYKGMMLSGVPNAAFTIGYANASWTHKADLTARYVCRLLTTCARAAMTRAPRCWRIPTRRASR